MLKVLSEHIEPWFIYIWEQFVVINFLKTDYRLMTYAEYAVTETNASDDHVIEYCEKPKFQDSLHIIKKCSYKTDEYEWIQPFLPVYRNTFDEKVKSNYDIFYNAFVHLSCLEEWKTSASKQFNAYSFKHPRKNKKIWKIPVVNYLFDDLERIISSRFQDVAFGKRVKPKVEFSHDVDYIKKTIQLRIKQSSFLFFNSMRLLGDLKVRESLINSARGINFLLTNSEYWCFDQWTDLEKELDIQSVYYIYTAVKSGKPCNVKRWLIDPSYNISKNKKLQDKCKELLKNGTRIGLHGSYYSGLNEILFRKEKMLLEESINHDITKTRIHWLNYYNNTTPGILEKAGIIEDSSIAFNDISGFRAGIASRYNPYDHLNQRAFKFYEIPLVIMDSQLYDYTADSSDTALSWFYNAMASVKNFFVSVDWHQRVIHKDYGWDGSFAAIAGKSSVD